MPLYKFSPAEKWEKEGIRVVKLRLQPTKKQKQILEDWSNTTRYVYNKCLSKVKEKPELVSSAGFLKIKKTCITKKDNNIIKDDKPHEFENFLYSWELNTPKDIRNGALRDIQKAYKTAFSNLKAGNINRFGLNFRRKKDYANQSMEIPDSAIKLNFKKDKLSGCFIYPSYIKSSIKIDKRSLKGLDITQINYYCRLKKENNMWILCVPIDTKSKKIKIPEKTCAIDPGIRKFQVIYSEDSIISISTNKEKVERIYQTLDKFQGLRDTKKIKQKVYDKKRCRLQYKLSCLIDDMHYKTISYLTKNFTSILLPSFETQDMVRKLDKKTSRNMMNYCFYKFKQRLEDKCKLLKHCNVTIVNEAFTSQTCGFCGKLNPTKKEMITCSNCKETYDRDVNGSRNIYIKYVKNS
ncbi:MAG: RNA-guided endonuclease InsQ/TnpB family protein [Cetobacterium sp.]